MIGVEIVLGAAAQCRLMVNPSSHRRLTPNAYHDQTPCGRNDVEFPLAGNVSANVGVRHTDYGQRTCDLTNPTYESLVDNSVRAGINYHFN